MAGNANAEGIGIGMMLWLCIPKMMMEAWEKEVDQLLEEFSKNASYFMISYRDAQQFYA